jgi:quercetin dioxygenase-like cupin family protein
MTIKDIKLKLKTSNNPVAKSLHQGLGFKTLVIGFKKGMILKEHKAHIKSKLTVLEGAVIYKEEHRIIELEQYDEVEIPIEITHSVEAKEDSLCIVTQGE